MSRKMKSFADYFLSGMQMGGNWWNQAEQHSIARERNKLKQQSDAIRNAREDKRLSLYGQNVQADIALKQARTHRTMNPIAKGGGGKGVDPEVAALEKRAAARGIIGTPGAEPAQTTNITNVTPDADAADTGTVAVPTETADASDDSVPDVARGGMIRGRRYATGGIVEGMSLQEAQGYDTGFTPSSKPRSSSPSAGGAMGGLGGAMNKGVAAGIDAYKKARDPKVTATGAKGSGEGGKYTTDDLKKGGVLDTGSPFGAGGSGATFRRGGPVRRYAEGGAVEGQDLTQGYDWKAAEKERENKTQQRQTEQVAQQAQQNEEEETRKKQASGGGGGFGASFADALSGSANGATGSGGDSTNGVSGTGGVGGSADAADGGVGGADAGATYRRGGRVRRYQSGGRVMREESAIDTGTSGPGSGYGYRAAPPSRRY
jgi:hypothetical protein